MAEHDADEYDDDVDDVDEDDDEGSEPEVTIEISGLSLFTHVGVTAAEREVGQRLLLDLRLDVGECDATVTDRIEDTVDYGQVCEWPTSSPSSAPTRRSSGCARRSPTGCWTSTTPHAVWVKAAKPEPPLALPVSEVSVEVWREARRVSGRGSPAQPVGYLGLGSNIGDRRAHLAAAVAALPGHGVDGAGAPRRCTRPSRSGWCSTSPSSSTPACGSRPSSDPRSCSTPARRSSARSAAPPAARATARG